MWCRAVRMTVLVSRHISYVPVRLRIECGAELLCACAGPEGQWPMDPAKDSAHDEKNHHTCTCHAQTTKPLLFKWESLTAYT